MIEIVVEGPAKNALGTALMTSLAEQIAASRGAPLLLRGAGDAFSAGLDLKEVVGLDVAGMGAFLRRLQDVLSLLFHHPGPTVACVNGHAIAGGCLLALACDHRVVTSDPRARLGLNEVALGLRFPPSVLGIVRYRVGRMEEVVLGAGLHAPVDALRLGLVDEVADDALAVAQARLAALAAHPREAYALTKQDLRGRIGRPDPEMEGAFLTHVLPSWTSEALRVRIRGFLDRKR